MYGDNIMTEVAVDFISDMAVQKFLVDNVHELKRMVAAYVDEDINWNNYAVKVNGRLIGNSNYAFKPHDVVRAHKIGPLYDSDFHIESQGIIQRPLLNPQLRTPQFAMMRGNKQVVGVYCCERCDGPIVKNAEDCLFCGYKLNWEN